MTELIWSAGLVTRDSRQNPSVPIVSIVGAAKTSSVLAGPLFLFKWLLVACAAMMWIVLVPLFEVIRDVLRFPLEPYPAGR